MRKKIFSIYLCMLLIIPLMSVSVIANGAPDTPTIEGPTNGKPGVEYDYTFMSVDPDGDDVYYMVSWGCCGPGQDFHTYGRYESGVETIIEKGYGEEGTYIISAYAKDMDGAESDIATLEVTMPRSHQIFSMFFMGLLERFPYALLILRHLLGL
jgi:hypothetical protein